MRNRQESYRLRRELEKFGLIGVRSGAEVVTRWMSEGSKFARNCLASP